MEQKPHYEPRLDERSPYDTYLDDLIDIHRVSQHLPRPNSRQLDECILDFLDAQDFLADEAGASNEESFDAAYDAHIAGSEGENLAITFFYILDAAARQNVSLSYFLKLYRRRRTNLRKWQSSLSSNS